MTRNHACSEIYLNENKKGKIGGKKRRVYDTERSTEGRNRDVEDE